MRPPLPCLIAPLKQSEKMTVLRDAKGRCFDVTGRYVMPRPEAAAANEELSKKVPRACADVALSCARDY